MLDGEDFIGGEQAIVFSAGDFTTRKCTNYTIIDNNVPEVMEDFLIVLSSPVQEVIFQPSDTIQVLINDEDRKWLRQFHRILLFLSLYDTIG